MLKRPIILLILLFFWGCTLFAQNYQLPYSSKLPPSQSQAYNIPASYRGETEFGDLNGDGLVDFVICGFDDVTISSSNPIPDSRIYFGDSVSGFTLDNQSVLVPVGLGELELIDLDSDGDLDIVIGGDGQINFYENDGSGTFSIFSPALMVAGFDQYERMKLSDLDLDGDADLIFQGNTSLDIYSNDSSLGFNLRSSLSISASNNLKLLILDWDGNGIPDIYPVHNNRIYTNNGNFVFSPSTFIPGANSDLGDIDNDGDEDLIMLTLNSYCSANQVFTYEKTASGAFNTNADSVCVQGLNLYGPARIRLLDLNGDGYSDIFFQSVHESGGPFSLPGMHSEIFFNDGNGAYAADSIMYLYFVEIKQSKPLDIDGDGDLDFFSNNRDFSGNLSICERGIASIHLNDGNGRFSGLNSDFVYANDDFDIEDFDNDGDLDVLALKNPNTLFLNSFKDHSFVLYENNGSGNFLPVFSAYFPSNYWDSLGGMSDVEMIDLNNDQILDLVIALDSIHIFLSNGNGGFSDSTYDFHNSLYSDPWNTQKRFKDTTLLFEDFDLDSDIDFISPNGVFYKNDGSGKFQLFNSNIFSSNTHPDKFNLIHGDFDLDGDFDIVKNGNEFYENDGMGNFTLNANVPFPSLGYKANIIYHLDLNQDSLEDLIYFKKTSGQLNTFVEGSFDIFLADGNGGYSHKLNTGLDTVFYQAFFNYLPGYTSYRENNRPKFTDIDLDGDLDLYAQHYEGGSNCNRQKGVIYLNNGDAEFYRIPSSFPQGSRGFNAADFGDFNNDGISESILRTSDSLRGPIIEFLELNGLNAISIRKIDTCVASIVWDVNSQLYDSAGTYYHIVNDPVNGDSLYILDFDIQPLENVIDTAFCPGDTIMLEGQVFTDTGSFVFNYSTSLGCDSIIKINIIPNVDNTFIRDTICSGLMYSYNGQNLSAPGNYNFTFTNSSGCDSIVNLEIATNLIEFEYFDTLCHNENFLFYGQQLNLPGTYSYMDSTNEGCDSLVILNLSLGRTPDFVFETICSGQSYLFDGQLLDSSGIYTANYNIPGKCDSIINLNLTVTDTIRSNFYEWICKGDSVFFEGNYITQAGLYFSYYQNSQGCDSLVRLVVNEISFDTTLIMAGNTINSNNNFGTYQWLDCDNNYAPIPGATSQSYTPMQDGTYAVELSSQNCIDTSDCVFIMLSGLESLARKFRIYPNPNNGIINYEYLEGDFEIEGVEILSIEGKEIDDFSWDRTNRKLEVHSLPEGMYHLRLLGRSRIFEFRFIKL